MGQSDLQSQPCEHVDRNDRMLLYSTRHDKAYDNYTNYQYKGHDDDNDVTFNRITYNYHSEMRAGRLVIEQNLRQIHVSPIKNEDMLKNKDMIYTVNYYTNTYVTYVYTYCLKSTVSSCESSPWLSLVSSSPHGLFFRSKASDRKCSEAQPGIFHRNICPMNAWNAQPRAGLI